MPDSGFSSPVLSGFSCTPGVVFAMVHKITRMAEDRSPKSLDAAALDALKEAVAAGLPTAISDLGALVRIPSVSWDGFDPAHVEASAAAARDLLEATGVFDKVIVSRARARGDVDGQAAVLGTPAA